MTVFRIAPPPEKSGAASFLALLSLLAIPFSEFTLGRVGINLSFSNIALVSAIALISIYCLRFEKRIALDSVSIWVPLFLGSLLLGNLYHESPPRAASLTVSAIGAIAYFYVAVFAVKHTKEESWQCILLLAGTFATCIAIGHHLKFIPFFENGPAQASPFRYAPHLRPLGVTGLLTSRGNYGILCFSSLAAACIWLLTRRVTLIFQALLASGIIIWAIALSFSRSTWLGFMAFLAVLLPTAWIALGHTVTQRKRTTYIAIACVALLYAALFFSGLGQRTVTHAYNLKSKTVDMRLKQYGQALEVIAKHPLTGLGPQFEKKTLSDKKVIHNIFLRLGASYGLFPAILFSALILSIYAQAFCSLFGAPERRQRLHSAIWLAALSGICIELIFFGGMNSKPFWAFLGLAHGDLMNMRNNI